MTLRALLLLIALSLPGAASGEPEVPCAWETAQPVSLRALERAPSRWVGACVRVRGDLDTLSLSHSRRAHTVVETVSIGAYFASDALSDMAGQWSRPRRVEVLGAVGLCRDVCADADADTICMPLGWCHYYDDPFVMIEAIR